MISLKKITKNIRYIFWTIFIFSGIIDIIFIFSDFTLLIPWIISLLIWYYIFPNKDIFNIKKYLSWKNKSITNDNSEKTNNYKEDIYNKNNHRILKSEYWDTLNVNMNLNQKWELFRWKALNSYIKINNKLEEVKNFWDIEQVKEFEKDVYIFFEDRVLKEALDEWIINKIEPENKTISYYTENNAKFRKYEYWIDNLSQEEFNYAKDLYLKILERDKISHKIYIYQLYAKTLRRIWNFYKKNKEYQLALNIFMKIKWMYQDWINDWKSIIKCKKELTK